MYDMEFLDPTMTTLALLRQTWTVVSKVSESKLAKVGLTPEKLAVMWACRDYPGTLTPAEISRLLSREAQSIAGLLNRMEKDGLVKRIPKRKGHPFTQVKLTAKGEELCDPGIQAYKEVIQGLSSELSAEEREQFHNTLYRLRQKMFDQLHMEVGEPPALPQAEPISLKW
jgi:MarR family transcriptional regulator for hemolysin